MLLRANDERLPGRRGDLKMKCLSLDYKSSGVAVRRKFAMTNRLRDQLYGEFRPVGGCVAIVTCGRSEFYFTCPREQAESILQKVFGESTAIFRFYGNDSALRHLFELAAGLCSMLVGEDEILGQVRDGYETARKNGMTERWDAVFQAALACGKKVRSHTGISSQACSLATLAANAVFHFKRGHKTILLIGATGKIGGSVLKNLAAGKNVEIYATLRTHAFEAKAENVHVIPYEERYKMLDEADCVVCATASPHTILQAEDVRENLHVLKPRLFIDLAVPPDIDPAAADIGECTLLGVDGFRAKTEENNRKKQKAAQEAGTIVNDCIAEFLADDAARRHAKKLANLGETERRALYALRKSDPQKFAGELEKWGDFGAENE